MKPQVWLILLAVLIVGWSCSNTITSNPSQSTTATSANFSSLSDGVWGYISSKC